MTNENDKNIDSEMAKDKPELTGIANDNISMGDIKNGSRETFEAVVNAYMKDAYYIALGFVGNHDDAMDLSQDAFFKAYKHRKSLREDAKFFPWFYQILKNLCFSYLRKKRNRPQASLDQADAYKFTEDRHDNFDPQAVTQKDEAKQQLWQAIAKLNEKHREVIILRHFREFSYDKIAQMLFCSRGTVTSRLYYARKRLKEILQKQKGGQ